MSHAHPELLDESGNIRDTAEIEKMEKEAKEKLIKTESAAAAAADNSEHAKNSNETTDSSNSGSSSKTSTPGPSDSNAEKASNSDSSAVSNNPISVPLPPSMGKVQGPPLDAKPIPVTAIEGGIPANSRPPAPVLQTTAAALPLVARPSMPSNVKPIRPPVNARPIVPATGPQIMPGGMPGSATGINLKPIQPRPTIMPDPTPNLALDDLKKAKKAKKTPNSPGNSPPRGLNGASPKHQKDNHNNNQVELPAKSPAYSDISDDESGEGRKKKANSSMAAPLPPGPPIASVHLSIPNVSSSITTSSAAGSAPPPPGPPSFANFPPFALPPTASLPTVPVSPAQANKEKKELITGPQPGTIEYEKMMLAYGFPPFPYPIPPGMDPNMHMHFLATDPGYKAKYEKERAEKEKAFKEQIDRDNREKDRKAGVKLPEEQQQLQQQAQREAEQQQQQKKSFSPMISVKPEFRDQRDLKKEKADHHKAEPQQHRPPSQPNKKHEDEGIKATMETRGPPPATPTSFASLMHPALMGRNPFGGYDPAMLAGMPPHVLASLYGSNPYAAAAAAASMQPLGGMRPPFMPPSSNPEDLSRSAALAMAAMSSLTGGSAGSSATKALDLLQQHANQYYAAAIAASAGMSGTTTTSSASSPSSHKIHELQERALKSPVTSRHQASSPASSLASRATPTSTFSTIASMASSPKTTSASMDLSKRQTPSPRTSRSPPPMRHVHTHTHTHFGLGYPLLPPPSGVPGVTGPPAAHTPFPPTGFSSKHSSFSSFFSILFNFIN